MIFAILAALQATVAPATQPTSDTLRAEAYIAAQHALASEAGDALAKLAARFASGEGPIATMEREREQNLELRAQADARYLALLGADDAQAQTRRDKAAKERNGLDTAIADADERIARIDPAYGELRRPSALSIAETQALLKPQEGLLLFMPAEDATYVFAVTHEGAGWARASAWPEAQLDAGVKSLRASIVTDLLKGTQSFDRMLAYTLYDALVRPIEPVLAGKTALMVVAGGSLGTLPVQLLVTDKPLDARSDDPAMRATHWLVDRYALATLPAVSSLRALRCLLVPPEARAAGCGPAAGNRVGGSPRAAAAKQLVGFGAPALAPANEQDDGRGMPPVETVFRGGLADGDRLRNLPSLPGSQAELEAVRALFGADAEIETGIDATETRIKRSPDLPQARFVIFSTHGLLAKEARYVGASEPGLVFTPPADAMRSDLDDGLLTMSEAAQLKLSADLVVLSACNTAASDGKPGSSGLSGLARAFLFAGAHSLLVSNWVVSDKATMALMRTVFATMEANPAAARAEALRQAVMKVRAMPGFAAPGFWAPFVLVGTPM